MWGGSHLPNTNFFAIVTLNVRQIVSALQPFKRLHIKLTIAFQFVMLVPVIAIVLYGYLFTNRLMSQQILDSAAREVQLQAGHIVRSLGQAQGDALHLSQLRSLSMLRRLQSDPQLAGDRELWREEAAQDMMVLLSVRPMYQNVRYIDSTSQEVIRVESDGSEVRNLPVTSLQNRRAASYFERASSLPTGSAFVSSFALDEEDSNPEQPLVHYTITLGADGLVLIDIHADWILHNLPTNVQFDTWALIDHNGHYLVYPDNYQPVATSSEGLATISPGLDLLISGGHGSFETQGNVYVYDTIVPSASRPDSFWVLYRDTPHNVLFASVTDFFQKAALFTVIAVGLAILIAAYVGHNIVDPLLHLQRQAARLGQGGEAPLPPDHLPDDEIGQLSRTFYDMAHELERKRRESKLLIERLIRAQEEERKLVAFDLHDGLLQQLVGARLQLTTCRQHCPIEAANGQLGLAKGCETLTEAIIEGRRIIEGLRPAALDDLGLSAALVELAQGSAQTAGWDLKLDIRPLKTEPEKSVSVTLYRIAQEALNNIRKHASATQVQVHLSNGNGIFLSVTDNGDGFDPQTVVREERGLGITTMHERAHLLNGSCTLTSAPGRGTSVVVAIPWQSQDGSFIPLTTIHGGRHDEPG